jgi:hypothetical protein
MGFGGGGGITVNLTVNTPGGDWSLVAQEVARELVPALQDAIAQQRRALGV